MLCDCPGKHSVSLPLTQSMHVLSHDYLAFGFCSYTSQISRNGFILVVNCAQGLSTQLSVSTEQIVSWHRVLPGTSSACSDGATKFLFTAPISTHYGSAQYSSVSHFFLLLLLLREGSNNNLPYRNALVLPI